MRTKKVFKKILNKRKTNKRKTNKRKTNKRKNDKRKGGKNILQNIHNINDINDNKINDNNDEEFLNIRRPRSIQATPQEKQLCAFSYNVFGPSKLNQQMEYKDLCDYDEKYLQKQGEEMKPLYKKDIDKSSDANMYMKGIFESVIYDIEKGGGVFEIKNLDGMKRDIQFYKVSGILTEDDANQLLDNIKDTEKNYIQFITNVLKNKKFLPVAGGSEVSIETPYDWFQSIRNVIRILSNTQKGINMFIQSKMDGNNQKQNKTTKSTKAKLFKRK